MEDDKGEERRLLHQASKPALQLNPTKDNPAQKRSSCRVRPAEECVLRGVDNFAGGPFPLIGEIIGVSFLPFCGRKSVVFENLTLHQGKRIPVKHQGISINGATA